MAAFVMTITLSNGDTLSLAGNSTAINAMLNCSLTGVAASTSPIDFTVSRDCYVADIITTGTAGELEFIGNDVRSGKKIPIDARWSAAYDRKRIMPRIGFRAGKKYNAMVTATTS